MTQSDNSLSRRALEDAGKPCIGGLRNLGETTKRQLPDGCEDECLALVDMEDKSMKMYLEDLQPSFDLTGAWAYEFAGANKIEGSLLRAWWQVAHDPDGNAVDWIDRLGSPTGTEKDFKLKHKAWIQ